MRQLLRIGDGHALHRTVPRIPQCHAVLGSGGNGITFSALAAQMLRNQIGGSGDPDSDLFFVSTIAGS